MTTPILSRFTWINQGSSTAVTSSNGTVVVKPEFSSGDSWRILTQPVSGVYNVNISFTPLMMDAAAYGLALTDSTTGKLIVFGSSTNGGLRIMKYNSPTSWNSDYVISNVTRFLDIKTWYRVDCDGTNLTFMVSVDGSNFSTLKTVAQNDFMTVDGIGFTIIDSGNLPSSMRVNAFTKS